jgi:hypothetical protein
MTNEVVLRPPTAEEIAQARLPARYEAARTAIAECVDLEELKALSDRQAALTSYARLAQDTTLHNLALRIQQRAQRRMGELIKTIPPAQGANLTAAGRAGAVPISRRSAATQAGISERQRKTALRIASIPEADFEAAVESDDPPTITEMAMRGTATREFARVPDRPPDVLPADPALVARAHRWLREFAAFCGVHDPVAIALGCRDADELRGHVETIDSWLDRFVTRLPESPIDEEAF